MKVSKATKTTQGIWSVYKEGTTTDRHAQKGFSRFKKEDFDLTTHCVPVDVFRSIRTDWMRSSTGTSANQLEK